MIIYLLFQQLTVSLDAEAGDFLSFFTQNGNVIAYANPEGSPTVECWTDVNADIGADVWAYAERFTSVRTYAIEYSFGKLTSRNALIFVNYNSEHSSQKTIYGYSIVPFNLLFKVLFYIVQKSK